MKGFVPRETCFQLWTILVLSPNRETKHIIPAHSTNVFQSHVYRDAGYANYVSLNKTKFS